MLANARETEALGFDGLYLVDHFYGLKDVSDPTHEAWTMLAALAPFTQRLRLGVMVTGNTYREPAFLLKQAMTVDHVSGGRVDFGVGAGWLEREHEAYGFPFPSAKERVDRFAEALALWEALQRNDRTTFEGAHYRLLDAPFEPKSLQPGGQLPLLIGGSKPRMLRLVARYANIWNCIGTPDEAQAVARRLDAACRDVGRDPATIERAVSPSLNLLASRDAFIEGVAGYHAAGFTHITMPWPRTEEEVPVLREVARTVIPALRGAAAPDASNGAGKALRPVTPGEDGVLRAVLGALDQEALRLLRHLATHPDEHHDGARLQQDLGFPCHADVTRTVARAGEAFAAHGLARPWLEAQRGYVMPAETAAMIEVFLDRTG
jgi:hypothetical protein